MENLKSGRLKALCALYAILFPVLAGFGFGIGFGAYHTSQHDQSSVKGDYSTHRREVIGTPNVATEATPSPRSSAHHRTLLEEKNAEGSLHATPRSSAESAVDTIKQNRSRNLIRYTPKPKEDLSLSGVSKSLTKDRTMSLSEISKILVDEERKKVKLIEIKGSLKPTKLTFSFGDYTSSFMNSFASAGANGGIYDPEKMAQAGVNAVLGMIPFVGGPLTFLVSMLWDTSSSQDVWGQIEERVKAAVSAGILNQELRSLKGAFKAFKAYSQSYIAFSQEADSYQQAQEMLLLMIGKSAEIYTQDLLLDEEFDFDNVNFHYHTQEFVKNFIPLHLGLFKEKLMTLDTKKHGFSTEALFWYKELAEWSHKYETYADRLVSEWRKWRLSKFNTQCWDRNWGSDHWIECTFSDSRGEYRETRFGRNNYWKYSCASHPGCDWQFLKKYGKYYGDFIAFQKQKTVAEMDVHYAGVVQNVMQKMDWNFIRGLKHRMLSSLPPTAFEALPTPFVYGAKYRLEAANWPSFYILAGWKDNVVIEDEAVSTFWTRPCLDTASKCSATEQCVSFEVVGVDPPRYLRHTETAAKNGYWVGYWVGYGPPDGSDTFNARASFCAAKPMKVGSEQVQIRPTIENRNQYRLTNSGKGGGLIISTQQGTEYDWNVQPDYVEVLASQISKCPVGHAIDSSSECQAASVIFGGTYAGDASEGPCGCRIDSSTMRMVTFKGGSSCNTDQSKELSLICNDKLPPIIRYGSRYRLSAKGTNQFVTATANRAFLGGGSDFIIRECPPPPVGQGPLCTFPKHCLTLETPQTIPGSFLGKKNSNIEVLVNEAHMFCADQSDPQSFTLQEANGPGIVWFDAATKDIKISEHPPADKKWFAASMAPPPFFYDKLYTISASLSGGTSLFQVREDKSLFATTVHNRATAFWARKCIADVNPCGSDLCVSFESTHTPSEFIRHSGGKLMQTGGSRSIDRADSSFCVRQPNPTSDPNGVHLQAVTGGYRNNFVVFDHNAIVSIQTSGAMNLRLNLQSEEFVFPSIVKLHKALTIRDTNLPDSGHGYDHLYVKEDMYVEFKNHRLAATFIPRPCVAKTNQCKLGSQCVSFESLHGPGEFLRMDPWRKLLLGPIRSKEPMLREDTERASWCVIRSPNDQSKFQMHSSLQELFNYYLTRKGGVVEFPNNPPANARIDMVAVAPQDLPYTNSEIASQINFDATYRIRPSDEPHLGLGLMHGNHLSSRNTPTDFVAEKCVAPTDQCHSTSICVSFRQSNTQNYMLHNGWKMYTGHAKEGLSKIGASFCVTVASRDTPPGAVEFAPAMLDATKRRIVNGGHDNSMWCTHPSQSQYDRGSTKFYLEKVSN